MAGRVIKVSRVLDEPFVVPRTTAGRGGSAIATRCPVGTHGDPAGGCSGGALTELNAADITRRQNKSATPSRPRKPAPADGRPPLALPLPFLRVADRNAKGVHAPQDLAQGTSARPRARRTPSTSPFWRRRWAPKVSAATTIAIDAAAGPGRLSSSSSPRSCTPVRCSRLGNTLSDRPESGCSNLTRW